jgi:hypothetical protein
MSRVFIQTCLPFRLGSGSVLILSQSQPSFFIHLLEGPATGFGGATGLEDGSGSSLGVLSQLSFQFLEGPATVLGGVTGICF